MSGCFVVASNVGGISDIIEDGKTGYLVREKDPAAIADALCTILKQTNTLSSMRIAARQKMISQFDWQVIADQYAKVLNDKTRR